METIDAEMVCFVNQHVFCPSHFFNINVTLILNLLQNGYIKDIQQSIAVLNSTAPLICRIKEKLHYELQKIVTLRADNYDPKWLNNALDIELDVFYNVLDLNALRKVMLKGDVGLCRLGKRASYVKSHPLFLRLLIRCTIFFSQTCNLWFQRSCDHNDQSAMFED